VPIYRIVKPLGLFVGIVVVGLGLIFVGLRLTNHSANASPVLTTPTAPKALTQRQFDRAGNAICARYYRVDAPLSKKPPKTLRAVTRYLRIDTAAFDRQAASLRALVPPPNDAGMYRRLLRGVGRGGRDFHALLHDFETGQYRLGVLKARQLTPALDRRLNRLARKLGLNVCGLTGRQERARYG
jgi:hypothetical protein